MKVFIIAALTADGFIGRTSSHAADWSSKEDKQIFVQLTKESGVMIMGANTFDTIGRALPGRKTIVYTSRPEAYADRGVETTKDDPNEVIQRLEQEGYESVAVCGGAQIYDLFMQSGLVTDLYITYAPNVFGQGISLFANAMDETLTLASVERLGENSIFAHYSVT